MSLGVAISWRKEGYTKLDSVIHIPSQFECLNCGFDGIDPLMCKSCGASSNELSITYSITIWAVKFTGERRFGNGNNLSVSRFSRKESAATLS